MSDSTKTILWIVLAVIVGAAVIALVMRSSRRRRELDERRFHAGDLRAQAQEKAPMVQEHANRASVTEKIAAEARVEADRKAAAAARLEDQARAQRAAAVGAETERDELAREADRIDPDIETDDKGRTAGTGVGPREGSTEVPAEAGRVSEHRDDEHRDDEHRDDERRDDERRDDERRDDERRDDERRDDEHRVTNGVLAGASSLDDHDDEPDLADADDPFAHGRDERGAGGYDQDMEQSDSTNDTGASVGGRDDTTADEPTSAQTEPTTDDEGADSSDTPPSAAGDTSELAPSVTDESASKPAAESVAVPALDDRDDVLVGGGPPANDPGDHRGQSWATTPGDPGLEEGDDVVDDTDEGLAAHPPADAAPDGADDSTSADDVLDGSVDDAESSSADTKADQPDETSNADDVNDDASGSDSQDVSTLETAAPSAREAQNVEPVESDHPDSSDRSASSEKGANPLSLDGDEPVDEVVDVQSDVSDGSNEAESGGSGQPTSGDRRISTFDEVIDGGFGIGSAQPIQDGAQPLAHPVKAWHDRKSFVAPGESGYDGAEPDVWFYNEDAARRAGFSREGD